MQLSKGKVKSFYLTSTLILTLPIFSISELSKKLLEAAKKGNVEDVEKIIKSVGGEKNTRTIVNAANDVGQSALLWACRNNHEKVVNVLVRNKVDVYAATNQKDSDPGDTALMNACVRDYKLPIVKTLLKHTNADVGAQKKNKIDATFMAAHQGHLEILKILLETDPEYVDRKGFEGRTPLGAAAKEGHLPVVQYLINEWNVAIDSQEVSKATALTLAAQFNHTSVVKFLMENGASSYIEDNDGWD